MVIQRLNMDNSWWIQWDNGIRILIDPWLTGNEIDYFPWFNTQWHRTPPLSLEKISPFDAVLITQKYPDHFHLDTLKMIKPTRIMGPSAIKKKVHKHLSDVHFEFFKEGSNTFFNTGLRLHFLNKSSSLGPDFNAMLLENGEESLFIAPHSCKPGPHLMEWLHGKPPVSILFTTFQRYELPFWLGGPIAPGLPQLIKLVEQINPDKIVSTHDEQKYGKGLVPRMARIIPRPDVQAINAIDVLSEKYLDIADYQPVRI